MRIASLVPSWTETLMACGADVVARTRFCIHPAASVAGIPVVGGTKNLDEKKLLATGAEFLVLDQDENPKAFTEATDLPYFASHIRSVHDVAPALRELRRQLEAASVGDVKTIAVADQLEMLAARWHHVLEAAAKRAPDVVSWRDLPGVLEWWRAPSEFERPISAGTQFLYLIWRDPWMVASRQTFIGSMFDVLGFSAFHRAEADVYPQVPTLEGLPRESTVLLFSSEPFPFAKFKDKLLELGYPCALVDGESYSWFGLRSLEFLEGAVL